MVAVQNQLFVRTILFPAAGERADVSLALKSFVLLLGYFTAAAAFGHVINDLGDVEADEKAAKVNSCSQGGRVPALVTAVCFGVLSIMLLWLGGAPWAVFVMAFLELVLFLVYSFKPLRLKESVTGLLIDAAYATWFLLRSPPGSLLKGR
ncbi:UbiA family prenyltransferase [Verrucomicrobium spinosum]|uniref:UbiA family prenyltransferase n=1 Tax=Verrucomicrobium spinosum TaxID=2736 RepID=UPI00094624D1|nr:UbiA family prenyltransferase [Verrucomicrobium spinosum]